MKPPEQATADLGKPAEGGSADLSEGQRRRLRRMMRIGSRTTIPVYRLLGGRGASGYSPKGAPPVFLLTTTGRRSGKPRTVTLSYLTHKDDIMVVGTNGGLPTEPAWVLNLRETPEAVMQIGRDKTRVRASFLDTEELPVMWERILAEFPAYRQALVTANREVPIIRLKIA